MADAKSMAESLKEELFLKRKNGRLILDDDALLECDNYCEGYKTYLDGAKTEREAVEIAISMAQAKGFKEFKFGEKYEVGEKVYINNRGKAVVFAIIGEESVENGVNITVAHVDSPRLDLKPNPLYEDVELALFKTQFCNWWF